MPRYLTGLITTDYLRFPPFPYKSRSWIVDLLETNRSCDFHDNPLVLEGRTPVKIVGKEVVIEARNEQAAQKAAFLLQASIDAVQGSAFSSMMTGQLELCELKGNHAASDEDQQEQRSILSRSGIPNACLLAAKVGRNRTLTYALSKLWLSYQIFSIAGFELDPMQSPTIPKSPYPFDHVAYAQAIVLAYAAIEELGFEVRSSQSKPSRLENGEWNPEVRDDLIERLRTAKINLNEKYAWNLRGPVTALERERPVRIISQTPWAAWRIRDGFVEIIDAIAHTSWLRSKVSAHRSKYRFMRVLSVYEVVNCQHLAPSPGLSPPPFRR